MRICSHTFEQYMQLVKSFHGYEAPGVLIGGLMVDLAYRHLPADGLYDALSETRSCLPDAVQLLTPCTTGNGWLRVINLGRYALTLYNKQTGKGIRVYIDAEKLRPWPEISAWFFKTKAKSDQDEALLRKEIRSAGSEIFSTQGVEVAPSYRKAEHRDAFALCPLCHESYPAGDGAICRGCQGESPYVSVETNDGVDASEYLSYQRIAVEDAVGLEVLHDMTQVIPGSEKGPAFKKGHRISAGDICRLQSMGRRTVFAVEEGAEQAKWVHEDDAALAFASAMSGQNVSCGGRPSEGKCDLIADQDGMFMVDEKRLEAFNLLPGVMCASRKPFSLVEKGFKVAGTRAIPLFLSRPDFEKALSVLSPTGLFRVMPLRRAKVGILVTGTEVFTGLVEDRFAPIIRNKVGRYGCEVVGESIVPDERDEISKGVKGLLASGADLIVTTAGLSVDPDDVTRQGLLDAGATDLLYGAPILPGAMTLLARIGPAQVMGVPACALFHKITSFDVLLPRILAGLKISRHDLARISSGGFCLQCKACTYPKCPFGH